MDQRCERCLKALPKEHVGDPLCGPCRRDVGVRQGYVHLAAAEMRGPFDGAAAEPPRR